jgi:3-oxoacyl-[acyl-carrier-protein] synthase II
MSARRVVITGVGAVTPLGLDVPTLWSALTAGRSGIRPIKSFDTSAFDTKIAGEVQDFDPTRFFDRKDVRRADRFAQLAVAAATEAVTEARLETGIDRDRVGVSIATAAGGLESVVDTANTLRERGPNRVSPFFVTMYIANAASGLVSLRWGFRGPSLTHVSACASSSHSVGEAAEAIKRGQVDVMVAGGSEAVIVPVAVAASATCARSAGATTSPSARRDRSNVTVMASFSPRARRCLSWRRRSTPPAAARRATAS